MDVRAQMSMVFHLDKCIGCHTCSVACKNQWTDRPGAEYMWWNNVETKPGTGFPTQWEDQDKYHGGWQTDGENLSVKLQDEVGSLANLFFNPKMPSLDDYYEPWTYDYQELFNAPEGDDQPTARPISQITKQYMEIESGPNWDDDLGGSGIYAANDPNFKNISEEDKNMLFELEKLVYFYVPRICNHCANPTCVAACPSGALYKRGEDGIVLVNQDNCRGWRMCVSGCPYKKVYYNWKTGKAEKCILCFPLLETGQAPACFHSCVGRIRYLGVLLYDADKIPEMAKRPDHELVDAQKEMILDPNDPEVIAAARANGVDESMIESAQKSPVYKYVMEWGIALPLHPEYRTLPMLFYVPPLLPVMNEKVTPDVYKTSGEFFTSLEKARLPIKFMANLFTAGNENLIKEVYKKIISVRLHRRAEDLDDIPKEEVEKALEEAGMTKEKADAIYRLTSLATYEERFVIPPMARELALESVGEVDVLKGEMGIGCQNCGTGGGCS